MLKNDDKRYIPLDDKIVRTKLKVGDIVICIENRHVKNINPVTLTKIYNTETLPFLTEGKEYKITQILQLKHKIILITDDGKERPVHISRLGILVNKELRKRKLDEIN